MLTWPEQVPAKRSLGSLAVLASTDALGTLPELGAGASWPEYSLERMWPEPGGRVVVTLGKEQLEAEGRARTAVPEQVLERTDPRLAADWQVALFVRQG